MGGILAFLAGLGFLVLGAELVVRGGTRLAVLLRIPPMVVGLTVVSFGNSTPELVVGITAGSQGNGGLAVGNIAGTNVFSLLFILGLSALCRTLPLQGQIFKLELPTIILAAGMMLALGWDGTLSRTDGMVMFTVAVIYTISLIYITRSETPAAQQEFQEEYGLETLSPAQMTWQSRLWYGVMLLLGIGCAILGADWLVGGAVNIARSLGATETLIGLTIVAMGTSAPELATTLVATYRNDRDVAVGNLLGSSIYNILVVLAITCMVTPGGLPVEEELMLFDVPLMAMVAFGAVPIFLTGRKISRWEGGLGVGLYLAYLSWLIIYRS